MAKADSTSDTAPPSGRFYVGGAVLVFGWSTPLFVPLVTGSALSVEWKTVLSGLLLLGIPELFTLAAVAILGKAGFGQLKRLLLGLLRKHVVPPAAVSRMRYRIGLFMFLPPLLFGWIVPYMTDHIPGYASHPLIYAVGGDMLLLASLFVLGGEFWDKLRSLLIHDAKAGFPEV